MKSLLFIYNPHAGKARITAHLHEITTTFQQAGYLPTVYATTGSRDAMHAVQELAEHYDHLVCAGGDGTLSEVITGLVRTNYHGKLGYIPAGSTNDFAKTLALPIVEQDAAEIAVNGEACACDVGRFNEHIFVYVAAFGVFTAVSYETPQGFKNLFGHMAYVLEGIRSLSEVTPYHLRVQWDDGELEDEFIYGAVSNSISVGGFRGLLSEQVILDDGLFEVTLVRRPKSLVELNTIISALVKGQPDDRVLAFQTRKLCIQSAIEVPWTLDGENGGKHCLVDIENLHNAVNLLTNLKG